MITIDNPTIHKEGDKITISYPLEHSFDAPKSLNFSIDSSYQEYFNVDNADGALVALLPWIAQRGGKVVVKSSISPLLYHSGIRLLSHILCGLSSAHSPIHIVNEVRLSDPVLSNTRRVGVSGSLGVDSLSAISDNENHCNKVTHLFHNNCGSHWSNMELLQQRRELSQNFAHNQNLAFVAMDSNLSDFYGDYGYIDFYLFLDAGSILALNGLFSHYMYGSSYEIYHTKLSRQENHISDILTYEPHILHACETEYTRFISHGMDLSRERKISLLCQYEPTKKYLNVCVEHINNCGKCIKCMRTITQMFYLGILDDYEDCFDLTLIRQKKIRFLGENFIKEPNFFYENLALFKKTKALTKDEKKSIIRFVIRKKPMLGLKMITALRSKN